MRLYFTNNRGYPRYSLECLWCRPTLGKASRCPVSPCTDCTTATCTAQACAGNPRILLCPHSPCHVPILHLSMQLYHYRSSSDPRICPQITPSVSRTYKSRWTSVQGTHGISRWDHYILQSLCRECFHVLSNVAIFIFSIHRCPWGMLEAQTVNAVCQRQVFL